MGSAMFQAEIMTMAAGCGPGSAARWAAAEAARKPPMLWPMRTIRVSSMCNLVELAGSRMKASSASASSMAWLKEKAPGVPQEPR